MMNRDHVRKLTVAENFPVAESTVAMTDLSKNFVKHYTKM